MQPRVIVTRGGGEGHHPEQPAEPSVTRRRERETEAGRGSETGRDRERDPETEQGKTEAEVTSGVTWTQRDRERKARRWNLREEGEVEQRGDERGGEGTGPRTLWTGSARLKCGKCQSSQPGAQRSWHRSLSPLAATVLPAGLPEPRPPSLPWGDALPASLLGPAAWELLCLRHPPGPGSQLPSHPALEIMSPRAKAMCGHGKNTGQCSLGPSLPLFTTTSRIAPLLPVPQFLHLQKGLALASSSTCWARSTIGLHGRWTAQGTHSVPRHLSPPSVFSFLPPLLPSLLALPFPLLFAFSLPPSLPSFSLSSLLTECPFVPALGWALMPQRWILTGSLGLGTAAQD